VVNLFYLSCDGVFTRFHQKSPPNIEQVQLYKLKSHWREGIEDLKRDDSWMNEFRNANWKGSLHRLVKRLITSFSLIC